MLFYHVRIAGLFRNIGIIERTRRMVNPMKYYQAYLFDADGTLIDTAELIYRCFVHTFKVFAGREPSREEIIPHIGLPLGVQLQRYFGALDDARLEEISREHMRYQLTIADQYLRTLPTVSEGLALLKERGKRLAVVTSRRIDTLKLYLDKTGLRGFFDALVTPECTVKHKPDPQPALKALEILGCNAAEALMVGDASYDIECGAAAGMDTAFVSWSFNTKASLKVQPTYIINDMRELTQAAFGV